MTKRRSVRHTPHKDPINVEVKRLPTAEARFAEFFGGKISCTSRLFRLIFYLILRQMAVIAQFNIISQYNHIQKMAWILNKTFTILEGEDGSDQDIVLTPRGSHKPRQYLPAASKRFVCQIVSFNQIYSNPNSVNFKCHHLLTYMQVFGFGFVTGKLPQCFTKPDIWHHSFNLDVQRSF